MASTLPVSGSMTMAMPFLAPFFSTARASSFSAMYCTFLSRVRTTLFPLEPLFPSLPFLSAMSRPRASRSVTR